jgi:lipopolysaccharide transport system ATP-binding protein
VKRYSSGMYVKLAFAVAAHLEPEILIVDEVLAVGDIQFQQKCIGKMKEVAKKEGRTVLFVSHNLSAIRTLTQQCLLLKGGKLHDKGNTMAMLAKYLEPTTSQQAEWKADHETNHPLQITKARILNDAGLPSTKHYNSDPIHIELETVVRDYLTGCIIEFWLLNSDGTLVLAGGDSDHDPSFAESRYPGIYKTRFTIPRELLGGGNYTLRINSSEGVFRTFEHLDVLQLEVVDCLTTSPKSGRRPQIGLRVNSETKITPTCQ